MLRISPHFVRDDFTHPDAARVFDTIVAALMQVPMFPSGALPVVIVVPRHMLMTMEHLHHPHDPDTSRSITQLLLDRYASMGLHSFVSDGEGDDEQREADADKRLIDLLMSHPAACFRDGRKRFDPHRAEVKDLRARLAHAEQLLRGDMTPEHEQALDCDHPSAWRDLALMKSAECDRLRARVQVTDDEVRDALGVDTGDERIIVWWNDDERIVAWCSANGFVVVNEGPEAGIQHGAHRLQLQPRANADVINGLAEVVGRPPLDVLAEIACVAVVDAEPNA